jgi:hypothetical protein
MTEGYWVGERRDSNRLWLYDPSLVHDDPNMVYLFHVDTADVGAHPKSFVKSILTTVKDPRRSAAVEQYLKWYEKYGSGFVAADRKRQQESVEGRRKEAIERHRAYLAKHNQRYSGVTEASTKTHRSTHCYRCKEDLDSSLHVECNSCNWLICYCGACGCGYEKWL